MLGDGLGIMDNSFPQFLHRYRDPPEGISLTLFHFSRSNFGSFLPPCEVRIVVLPCLDRSHSVEVWYLKNGYWFHEHVTLSVVHSGQRTRLAADTNVREHSLHRYTEASGIIFPYAMVLLVFCCLVCEFSGVKPTHYKNGMWVMP